MSVTQKVRLTSQQMICNLAAIDRLPNQTVSLAFFSARAHLTVPLGFGTMQVSTDPDSPGAPIELTPCLARQKELEDLW